MIPRKLFVGFMIFVCTLIAILLFNMFVFGRGEPSGAAPAETPAISSRAE